MDHDRGGSDVDPRSDRSTIGLSSDGTVAQAPRSQHVTGLGPYTTGEAKRRREQNNDNKEAPAMKSGTMLLLLAVLTLLVGCARSSSSSPSASPGLIRQALCQRDGGVWHADSADCEMQSPALK